MNIPIKRYIRDQRRELMKIFLVMLGICAEKDCYQFWLIFSLLIYKRVTRDVHAVSGSTATAAVPCVRL